MRCKDRSFWFSSDNDRTFSFVGPLVANGALCNCTVVYSKKRVCCYLLWRRRELFCNIFNIFLHPYQSNSLLCQLLFVLPNIISFRCDRIWNLFYTFLVKWGPSIESNWESATALENCCSQIVSIQSDWTWSIFQRRMDTNEISRSVKLVETLQLDCSNSTQYCLSLLNSYAPRDDCFVNLLGFLCLCNSKINFVHFVFISC